MPFEFYCTIEGTKQGKFKGESIREKHKDKLAGLSFRYGVDSPRDAASGLASGKRTHRPVCITKEWGASSPQIFQALVTNEILKSVLFEFYTTTAEGVEELYYTIKLTNATVSKLTQYAGGQGGQTAAKSDTGFQTMELEDVEFTFQKIQIDHTIAKTSTEDDWAKS